MARIHGRAYSKEDLYKYSVNPNQFASIEEIELKEGRADGLKVYRVRSSNGLAFDLLPGRNMDIGDLSYGGVNISLLTRNGKCAPQFMYPVGGEFERFFNAGMLWTVGLKNSGPNYHDGAQFHHYHGRIATLPVEQSWKRSFFEGDEFFLSAGSVTRDTTIGEYNLEFVREIRTSLSEPEIIITDSIENLDSKETDYVLLYHFNFGFPFIDESLRMLFPDSKAPIIPGNPESEKLIGEWDLMKEPVDGDAENLFFHSLEPGKDGMVTVKLENPAIGIGATIRYDTAYLPYLVEWRSIVAGEYAVGIEPSNNFIGGMPAEREAGRARMIAPGEKHIIRTMLGFYAL